MKTIHFKIERTGKKCVFKAIVRPTTERDADGTITMPVNRRNFYTDFGCRLRYFIAEEDRRHVKIDGKLTDFIRGKE